ncbi:hypothetical protein N581_07905 [Lactobacillus jensenii MD IIE-70(2)]|nr:hypothetical protein N581_07905 [Lactobacillus jensenii MD IIE-70(2)]
MMVEFSNCFEATKTSNTEPEKFDRLLRIDYKLQKSDNVYAIYVSHLDSDFSSATVKDFVNRYKDQKLVYIPRKKVSSIYSGYSVYESFSEDTEEPIAINTNYIYSISYEKIPSAFIYTKTYKKLLDMAKKFTKCQLYEDLGLNFFKIYPTDLKGRTCSNFYIDYEGFKLEFSYSTGIEVEEKSFNKLLKKDEKYKDFFEKHDDGRISRYLKFFEKYAA